MKSVKEVLLVTKLQFLCYCQSSSIHGLAYFATARYVSGIKIKPFGKVALTCMGADKGRSEEAEFMQRLSLELKKTYNGHCN